VEVNLYKISSVGWAVTSVKEDDPQVFPTVEGAADYLLSIGVEDEHIDMALVDMTVRGTTRANFGANGTFIFSDNVGLYGKFGTA
jgi:hypothetical protein